MKFTEVIPCYSLGHLWSGIGGATLAPLRGRPLIEDSPALPKDIGTFCRDARER